MLIEEVSFDLWKGLMLETFWVPFLLSVFSRLLRFDIYQSFHEISDLILPCRSERVLFYQFSVPGFPLKGPMVSFVIHPPYNSPGCGLTSSPSM